MRTKTKLMLFGATILALVGTLVLYGTAEGATATGSNSTDLRFHVKFSPFNLIDLGAPGFSDGDEIVFHDTLLTSGRQVGDELGSCVVVDAAVALANCTMVIRLSSGNISAQFANSPPPLKTLAITGGTGSYRHVDGEGTLVEAGDGTGTLTLHLHR
jgi:hypothetical protein